MSTGSTEKNNACRAYQQLIAWYPTQSLAEDDRRRVEEHIAACTDCAGLLQFASGLKAILAEMPAEHPEADVLVDYVENRTGMEASVRAVVEAHVETCSDCRVEIEMLEAVDQSEPAEPARDATSSDSRTRAHHPAAARRWWDILAGGVLRPAAAAVYLVIALISVGLLLSRPERVGVNGSLGKRAPAGEPGSGVVDDSGYSVSAGETAALGGVVILSDQDSAVRSIGAEAGVATIQSTEPRFLLLELTELDAPPDPGDVYTVHIAGRATGDVVFRKSVTGSAFRDNYTLGIFLEPGSLDPGEYVVDVKAPDGSRVFRSSLTVE